MKPESDDFRVRPGTRVDLAKRPTAVKPFYGSKKKYNKILHEQAEELATSMSTARTCRRSANWKCNLG